MNENDRKPNKSAKGVPLRKRTQISKANRTMFLWVASASVVIGFAAVAIVFLAQMLMFNEKVLKEKDNTIAVLIANNKNIPKLQSQVKLLDLDQNLIDIKANPDDQPIQVILDALPSEANSLALGASIQEKFLNQATLNSLQVDPVEGVEIISESDNGASSDDESSNVINFRFSVSGDKESLKEILLKIEKSIRIIEILSLKVESQKDVLALTIKARAFYEPERIVELSNKVITNK